VSGTGNNQWEYVGGNWTYCPAATAYQQDEHYAYITGAICRYRFNGTQVKIYTHKEPAGGRIGYTLDATAEQVFSNYAATAQGNSLSYDSGVIPGGNHVLTVRVVGSHEAAATSNTITVDKAEVYTTNP